MKTLKLIVISSLFLIANAYADINKLIKNVMPSGTMSNVTKNAIIHEQSAGHLMGGSVIVRTPAEPGLQLLNVQAPSCKIGGLPCGAQFELFGGAASILNGAEITRYFKGLAQNSPMYAGILLYKTMCPQCEDAMAYLDSKADWINSLAKTDCEDMAKLAGGALGKLTAGARATRQSAAVLNGDGKDLAHNTQSSKEDTDDPTSGNNELESMLGDNYNLVWKALEKNTSSVSDNNSLKEILMSISGTIIGKKDANGRRSVVHKRSLINKELIEEFVGSTNSADPKVNLYTCDEKEKCLNPKTIEQSMRGSDSLIGRIGTSLVSIAKKIKADKGSYSNEEETLIAMSSLSLITKIELDLGTYSNPEHAELGQIEFVEALSYDVITTYLSKLLKEVQLAVGELEYVQISDSGVFRDFDQETRDTMQALSRAKSEAFKRYDLIAHTKARLKQDIGYFQLKFEEFCNEQNEV